MTKDKPALRINIKPITDLGEIEFQFNADMYTNLNLSHFANYSTGNNRKLQE